MSHTIYNSWNGTFTKPVTSSGHGHWDPPPSGTATFRNKLDNALERYPNVKFDHVEIAHLGKRIAVFVTQGPQATVLYDKTTRFPSSKLMASLTLLGSP